MKICLIIIGIILLSMMFMGIDGDCPMGQFEHEWDIDD